MPIKTRVNKPLSVFFRDSGKFEAEFPLLVFALQAERAGRRTRTRFGVGDEQPRSPAGVVLPSWGRCAAANSNQMCRGLFSGFRKRRNA